MTPQEQRETDEETRLARIYEEAQEALRSAFDRYDPSHSIDERDDRRVALNEAQGRVDEGYAQLVRFWNIPNDAVMLEYLERPIGQREGWLETELKKHRARVEAERSRREGAEAEETLTEGRIHGSGPVNPHG